MKKLMLVAAVAALSGCSQPAEEAPAPAETATATAAAAAADDATGEYDVKMADGTMGKTTINADGTYVDVGPDGKETKGTFTRANGQDCFAPADGEAVCWTVTPPGADGSFTATTVDGKTTVTVSRAAAATPAPAAT